MKPFLVYTSFALVLLLVGRNLWSLGKMEREVAEADQQLITLHYSVPMKDYDSIERSARYTRALPWVADLLREVRTLRATSEYWDHRYGQLDLPRDSTGALLEQDPRIMFLAANAAYRSVKIRPGDPRAEKQLDGISANYAEVLKRDPANQEASYNYEFVARMRENLARAATAKPASKTDTAVTAPARTAVVTIHGRQGAPPEANMTPFKTVVPKSGEERKQDEEAGKGNKRVRKG